MTAAVKSHRTTPARVATAFATMTLVPALLFTAPMALAWSTLSGWSILLTFLSVLGLWSLNIGVLLLLLAGLPWLLLHALGLRSWRPALVAGFVVGCAAAVALTFMTGATEPELKTSRWIDGRAVMLDGKRTALGEAMYGPWAMARNGIGGGAAGALLSLTLWRIAYRRTPTP